MQIIRLYTSETFFDFSILIARILSTSTLHDYRWFVSTLHNDESVLYDHCEILPDRIEWKFIDETILQVYKSFGYHWSQLYPSDFIGSSLLHIIIPAIWWSFQWEDCAKASHSCPKEMIMWCWVRRQGFLWEIHIRFWCNSGADIPRNTPNASVTGTYGDAGKRDLSSKSDVT